MLSKNVSLTLINNAAQKKGTVFFRPADFFAHRKIEGLLVTFLRHIFD